MGWGMTKAWVSVNHSDGSTGVRGEGHDGGLLQCTLGSDYICQELLSFQPATLDNPVSLHVDNRMNNRCHYVFAFLHSNSLYCVLCDLQIPQFMFFLPLVYLK